MATWRFMQRIATHRATLCYVAGTSFKTRTPDFVQFFPTIGKHSSRTLSTASIQFSAVSSTAKVTSAPQVSLNSSELDLEVGGHKVSLNYLWLRDHCRCSQCYNHTTFQKNVAPHTHQADIKPVEVSLPDPENISLTWPDGHKSSFSVAWLIRHSYPGISTKQKRFLWNAESILKENIEMVPYEAFQKEEGLKMLLKNLVKYGFGVVEGSEASVEGTQRAAERLCIIQNTLFGAMYDFTSDLGFADTAYTNIDLGPHNDTTYFSMPCGIQIFHCLEHDGDGGQTLLVDGFHAAESLRNSDPEGFDLLCSLRVSHEFKDTKAGVEVRSLDPILKVHPITKDLEWIRYNHYDRSTISTIPSHQLPRFYQALGSLSETVESPSSPHWLKLKPGMVLFVDNWRVMHGRSAFTGRRRICGCYLPRDDWISRATIHGLL